MERRLTAILAADFVGYSARVGADEEGTVRAIRGLMDALELVVGLHRGRVVKTMGDGMLVEFGSVVDAVSCATVMQDRLAERNADFDDAQAYLLRIGVHVGDILVDQGDIFGDGVNIAARIEALAQPGGIVVSGRVHEDVSGRLGLAFRDMGEHALKNIKQPVQLFAIEREVEQQISQPVQQLPDKPSLAVLPLVNFSSDQENEYFADGLTEDIITALAHVPWMFVIARNSTFTYKGTPVDVRKVGRDLGVRYVFEGSVRTQGTRMRVTGQLVDAETGAHIWADKIDGSTDDIFAFQDQITETITAAIAPGIQHAEIDRSSRTPPSNLNAYDHYLRALSALNRAQISTASEHLDAAINISPTYAKAMAIRAWCYTLQVAWTANESYEANVSNGLKLAYDALHLDGRDLEVAAYAGYTISFFGDDIDRGRGLVQHATENCPSFAWAWTSRGMLEGVHGDSEKAVEYCQIAKRLNPRDPQMFRVQLALGTAYGELDQFEKAYEAVTLGLRLNPNIVTLYVQAISCLVRFGRIEEAREQARLLMVHSPNFRVLEVAKHLANFRHSSLKSYNVEALIAAGLPQ